MFKRLTCFFVVFQLMLTPVYLSAKTLTRDGTVTNATVFRNHADVTRVVEFSGSPGSQTVAIPLPSQVQSDRLRVNSNQSTQIKSFEIKRKPLKRVSDTRIRKLKDEIDSHERSIKKAKARIDAENERISFVKNWESTYNEKLAKEQLAKTFSKDEFHSIGESLVSQIVNARHRIIETRRQIDDFEQEIRKLRRELKQIQNRGSKTQTVGLVHIERSEEGPARLVLNYGVPQASWSPAYDVRVSPEEDELNLSLYGTVTQNTGKTWENVRLTLSTGRPAKGAGIPELDPWVLKPPEARPDLMKRRMDEDAAGMAKAMSQSAGTRAPQKSGTVEAGLNVPFPARQINSLPGDGSSRRILLSQISLPVQLSYRAVPARSEKVFLWLNATNKLDYPLPGGQAQVFLDDSFVGKTELNAIRSGDTMEISAGVDQRLSVDRTEIIRKEGKTYWEEKGKLQLGYRITVSNSRDRSVNARIIDRIPVSEHDKISVSINEISEPYSKKDNGKIHWTRKIKGGETLKLKLVYTITVPPKWKSIFPR